MDAGIEQKLVLDETDSRRLLDEKRQVNQDVALTLNHYRGPLAILGFGYLFAIVSLGFEHIY